MKMKIKEVRPARTRSYLKHKLISAAAMLVVSAIMMVSSSYAWYVLSTAPEVSNIKTQVGANGALEIALLNKESWDNLSLLDMGDIDESLGDTSVSAALANLTWGNLVDLDDSGYGLDKIVLQPARLFIEQTGNDSNVEYTVNESTLLKTPLYGEDGRVKKLETDKAVAYTYANGGFSVADSYGVRAIGTSSTMGVFQLGMNSARTALTSYANAAKKSVGEILQNTGGDLANIVVAFAVSGQEEGYTEDNVKSIKALAEGLNEALDHIETALRYTFAGYITTTGAYYVDNSGESSDNVNITAENYQTKLAEIIYEGEGEKTLSDLLTEYPGIETVIPGDATDDIVNGIAEFITKFDSDRTKVANAIAACDEKLTESGTATYSWSDLTGIINPLVNINSMTVNDKGINELKTSLKNEDGSINMGAAIKLVQDGLTITVPSGSGILGDIADFAGEYYAIVSVEVDGSLAGATAGTTVPVDVTMKAVGVVPTHLKDCSNNLQAAGVAEATESNSITDYYGYAIDLAFRTNATESNLLLQTDPENRIYDGDTRNASLQGGGSYMSFTTTADLSATKMVRLMSGLRVVFMDGDQKILAIAALDCTLGKDVYKPITDDSGNVTGYYLDGSVGTYQTSDVISTSYYENALPETSSVKFDKTTGTVTAKLYIYDFEMTKSTEIVNGVETVRVVDGEIQYTGGITLSDEPSNSDVIVALTQDVVQKVTALVYLDGSVVNNSMVAADAMHSMTGTLNLQFSSSAQLMPANNTQLQTSGSAVNYTRIENNLTANGYLSYNDSLYKIADDYSFYTGSDDKLYFATAESEYTELTAENISDVLTQVKLAVSHDSVNLAVGETAEVTLTLSDESLEDKVTGGGFAYNQSSLKVTNEEGNYYKYTLEGTAADNSNYFVAYVSVQIGSEHIKIESNKITVTVTETGNS